MSQEEEAEEEKAPEGELNDGSVFPPASFPRGASSLPVVLVVEGKHQRHSEKETAAIANSVSERGRDAGRLELYPFIFFFLGTHEL